MNRENKCKISEQKQTRNNGVKGLQPYHLFKVFDEYFVFDTTACRFYCIDELTSDFLLLSLSLSTIDAAKTLINSGKYSKDAVKSVKKEVDYLAKNGLFENISSYINIKKTKKIIQNCDICSSVENMQIALAENCNLACKYCYCSKNYDISNKSLISKDTIKKAIDFLLSQKGQNVAITMFGGEPLLNKPIIDYIMEYSKQNHVKGDKHIDYIMTTNATLLDEKTMDYIVNDNFGLLVSLDGPKEIHDAQCPTQSGGGSFDIATKNIKKLMQRRTVNVRATMAHPMPDLKKLVDYFTEFGFNRIVIGAATNRLDTPSEYDFNKIDMQEYSRQQEDLLPWTLEFLNKNKEPPYFLFSRWYNAIKNNKITSREYCFNCAAGTSVVGVDASGSFYLCAKFIGLDNWKIGDIEKGVDIELCKSHWKKYIDVIGPHCGKCWAYPVCNGPCLWECTKADGTIAFNDIYCDFMKKSIERSAYLCFSKQRQTDVLDENNKKSNS